MTTKTAELQRLDQIIAEGNETEGAPDADHVFIASVSEEFFEYIDAVYAETNNGPARTSPDERKLKVSC